LPASATKWFAGTDRLVGYFQIGQQGSADEWSIPFNELTYDSLLIATGNFKDWIILPKASVASIGDDKYYP
jgi:hypothetical protein